MTKTMSFCHIKRHYVPSYCIPFMAFTIFNLEWRRDESEFLFIIEDGKDCADHGESECQPKYGLHIITCLHEEAGCKREDIGSLHDLHEIVQVFRPLGGIIPEGKSEPYEIEAGKEDAKRPRYVVDCRMLEWSDRDERYSSDTRRRQGICIRVSVWDNLQNGLFDWCVNKWISIDSPSE